MPHEPRIPGLRRAVRLPGARIDNDVNDEISFHLESRVRELIAAGESEGAARLQPSGSSATSARRGASSPPSTGTAAAVNA